MGDTGPAHPVTEDELREVVGKYWVIDGVRPARIHANVPAAFASFADFAGTDIRDEGGDRKSVAAWLLQAHLAQPVGRRHAGPGVPCRFAGLGTTRASLAARDRAGWGCRPGVSPDGSLMRGVPRKPMADPNIAGQAAAPIRPLYTRVLLKLGGEMFGGGQVGLDPDVVHQVARQIAEVVRAGAQVAVVIGGGNFFRGAQLQQRGMERTRSDYMGMLGTVMNSLALQDFLEKEGIDTRVQTAITMGQVAEQYIPLRAVRHLEKGRVVIFGAGMGLPYFSTDTTAAQRALEIGAEVVLMAKAVDGVYTDDPRTNPDAELITAISHREIIDRGLKVADATAFSLCMDNGMPILVFNLLTDGNIARAVAGEKIGTLVTT